MSKNRGILSASPKKRQIPFHEQRPQIRPYFERAANEIIFGKSYDLSIENYEKLNNIQIIKNEIGKKTSVINGEELSDLDFIKENISEIKKELKSVDLGKLKSDILEIKQINQENDAIKNELLLLKEEIGTIKELLNKLIKINELQKSINYKIIGKNNDKEIKVISERKIIIWMGKKNNIFKIDDKINLEEFINRCIKAFNLINFNNIIIHYFNKFGKKYIIKNDEDFGKSLKNKVSKYYLTEDKNLFKELKCEYIKKDNNKSNNYIEKFGYIHGNNFESDKNEMEESKEKIFHFASLAQNEIAEKVDYFLNSADYISDFMKSENSRSREKGAKNFIDSKEIIKKPGLLLKKNEEKNDKDFILSLLAEILKDKKIDATIFKNENNESISNDKLSEASLQYLFCGLFVKKKIEINFNLEQGQVDLLNKREDELSDFIEEWKNKISNQLNINKKELSLINPMKKSDNSFSLDLISDDDTIFGYIKKLYDFDEINYIHEKSLIEACQLNNNIFDPNYNNEDGGWGINEKRGGEDFISPLGWKGYGINVKGKYDYGDNTWLDYKDREGVFAVAYLGISNIYENKEKYLKYITEVNSLEILKMNYDQTYKDDYDLRNPPKKCGCGVYLFQDPKIAENSAGIIDIYGIRYKVLLMCRVNPKKIRQPKGFTNCWILNPSPDEIRPYRILIKTIFNSPLAEASQKEFITCTEPSSYYQEIINKKDYSFYKTNSTENDNNYYVINKYTSNDYKYINEYLRTGKINEEKYTEKQIKSWVWCLHDALTNRRSNVSNSSYYFRGLAVPFSQDLDIGAKFYLAEFISVSKSLDIALMYSGGKTLFVIRIENNNSPPGFYCYDVHEMSEYTHEEEIVITSNCCFQITKKEKKTIKNLKSELGIEDKIIHMTEDVEILVIYLTCLGNYYDIKNAST